MSLILEALSKAKNDANRPTPDAQQQLAALTAPRHAERSAPRISMVMGIATVLAVTLLGALFIMRPGPATATASVAKPGDEIPRIPAGSQTEASSVQRPVSSESSTPHLPTPAPVPTPALAPQDRPALIAVQPYLSKPAAPIAAQPAAKPAEVPVIVASPPTHAPPIPNPQSEIRNAPPAATAPTPNPQPPVPAVAAPAPSAPPAPSKPELHADAEYVETLDVQATPVLLLKAIVWSDYTKIALIDNATVELDGSISGVKVVDIEPKRVKLEFAGKRFFLRLP